MKKKSSVSPGKLLTWFHNSKYLLRFVWKHRRFLKFLLKSAKRKKEILKFDLNDEQFFAKRPPNDVNLYLTFECNLSCKMCPYFGECGMFADKKPIPGAEPQLEIETYSKLANDLKKNPTFYYLSGGEPLLYRHGTANLIKELKKNNAMVALNTNGTLLAEQAEDLTIAGLDLLILSIDGPEEIHDRIRGTKGTFRKAVEGLKMMKSVRYERKLKTPVLSVLLTISKWNYHIIDQVPDIFNDWELDMLGINFSFFTNEEHGEKSIKIKQKEFGIESDDWKGLLIDVAEIDTKILAEKYASVLSAKKKFLLYTMPPGLKPNEVEMFYCNLDDTFGRKQCWKSWYRTFIQPNGDITTCEEYHDCVMGNIKTESILDIWNNEKYRHFRKVIKKIGYFPYCTRCTNGLYET